MDLIKQVEKFALGTLPSCHPDTCQKRAVNIADPTLIPSLQVKVWVSHNPHTS